MSESQLILNRFFSRNLFFEIVKNSNNLTYRAVVERFLKDSDCKSNGELIREVYSYMSHNYRNEYYYQNTLLNKLLIDKHNPETTIALTQLPVGKSKTDFVLINGKAVVYEIKTELDTFERLETQINDYYKAFDHVCLVTSPCHYKKACEILEGSNVGIYVVSKRGAISCKYKKEPKKETSFLEHETIFKVLRKVEYESILYDYFRELPKTTQVFYYGACFELFKTIPINTAYKLFLVQLKKRTRDTSEIITEVPFELRSLVYFSNSDKKNWNDINEFLVQPYRRG